MEVVEAPNHEEAIQIISAITKNISSGQYNKKSIEILKAALEQMKNYESIDQIKRKKPEFLYILIEARHIQACESIVKIGKTARTITDRFREYPKGSILLGSGRVNNCTLAEKILIDEFNKLYKRETNVGLEYFRGNISDMETTFYEMLLKIKKVEEILSKNIEPEHSNNE
jgi:hypothetical protein